MNTNEMFLHVKALLDLQGIESTYSPSGEYIFVSFDPDRRAVLFYMDEFWWVRYVHPRGGKTSEPTNFIFALSKFLMLVDTK